MNTIAIDFGSSRTKAAWLNPTSGLPELLPLGANGSHVMPSLFYIPRGDTPPCVGIVARDYVDEDPAGVVRGLKRRIHETSAIRKNGRSITPVDLAMYLFVNIRSFAEQQVFHAEVPACVLTVPVAFDSIQRAAIVAAARRGGFSEVATIEEPVAAARWWLAAEAPAARDYIVVCDVGGGTTDIALLRKTATGFEPFPEVPPAGFNEGGNDVDDRIFELLGQEMGTDILAKEGCRVQVQETRERFARDARVEIPLSMDGIRLRLSRTQVESCCGEFVEKVCATMRSFQQRMKDLQITAPLLIVGGGRHTLGLEAALKRAWKEGTVLMWKDSDFATVLGAVPGVGSVISKSNTRTALLDQYREYLRFAWVDKHISEPERHALLLKVSELGLSEDESHATEREIIGYTLKESKWLSQGKSESEIGDEAKSEAGIAKNRLMGNKLGKALFHSNNACDLEPTWADAFMLKGSILASLKSWTLAVVAFNRALQLHPKFAAAYAERGWCHIEAGDEDAAWNDFHLASEFGHGPAAVIGRAFVHLKKKLHSEAFTDLDAALRAKDYVEDMRHDSVLLHALCAWLCQKSIQSSKDAIYYANSALQLWKHEGKREVVDQMLRWTGLTFINEFGLELQIWLWTSCCEQCKGNKREAAAHFLLNEACQAPEGFWQMPRYHDFSFHAACVMASVGNLSLAQIWLNRLFETNPEFDIRTLHEESAIMRHAELKSMVRPKIEHEKDCSFMLNRIIITNKSPFTVHEIKVTAPLTRVVNGSKKWETVTRSHWKLKPGETHRWDNTFQDPGWFGGNIESVTVNVSCREDAEYID
jgi:actin-like ATPase involved in cell morphogenesis/tetratricopeptide (TPR) repeat protein